MKSADRKNENRQFAVLGLGRFGESVARTLAESGYDVLAFDSDADRVHAAMSYSTYAIQGDITDEEDMRSLGLSNFEVVIIAVGTDFEAAILATMIAKEQGSKYVLAKAIGFRQKKILESIGADRVVLPEMEMGQRVANNLVSSNILDYIDISEEFSIAEIIPQNKWIDKTLKESGIREETHLNVIAIKGQKEIFVSPKPNHIIRKGDVLVVVGSNECISSVR